MNPESALRLLNTRSMAYVPRIGGKATLEPNITASDVAYAVGCIQHRGAQLLVLYLYAHHEDVRDELEQTLVASVPNTWRDIGLIRIVLDDLYYARICGHCCGRGHVLMDSMLKECTQCDGTGQRKNTHAAHARRMGVHRSTWARTWAPRYADILKTVSMWQDTGLRMIRKKLS